jgi:hypothetical protein
MKLKYYKMFNLQEWSGKLVNIVDMNDYLPLERAVDIVCPLVLFECLLAVK